MYAWRYRRAKLPRYRKNPLPRQDFRFGPLTYDDMSGLPEREGKTVIQRGIRRSLPQGTFDIDDFDDNGA